jgi:hypothetical protein
MVSSWYKHVPWLFTPVLRGPLLRLWARADFGLTKRRPGWHVLSRGPLHGPFLPLFACLRSRCYVERAEERLDIRTKLNRRHTN